MKKETEHLLGSSYTDYLEAKKALQKFKGSLCSNWELLKIYLACATLTFGIAGLFAFVGFTEGNLTEQNVHTILTFGTLPGLFIGFVINLVEYGPNARRTNFQRLWAYFPHLKNVEENLKQRGNALIEWRKSHLKEMTSAKVNTVGEHFIQMYAIKVCLEMQEAFQKKTNDYTKEKGKILAQIDEIRDILREHQKYQ